MTSATCLGGLGHIYTEATLNSLHEAKLFLVVFLQLWLGPRPGCITWEGAMGSVGANQPKTQTEATRLG